MMMKRKYLLSGVIAVALSAATLSFQNCANTALVKELENVVSVASLKTTVCLNGTMSDYTIDSSYVINMNYVYSQGVLVADSDADGLSDTDEVRYGFSPTNRRSTSSVLDSICLNIAGKSACHSMVPVCSSIPNKLGLSDCDIKTLNLDQLYGHPDHGLDTDKDGIPDVLEISRGMFPNTRDDNDDPDHDLRLNSRELTEGTDNLYATRDMDSSLLVESTVSQVSGSTSCAGGESWKIEAKRIPLVSTKAYTDPAEISLGLAGLHFSHLADENVIVSFVKLKPKLGVVGKNSMIYFMKMKADRKKLEFTSQLNSSLNSEYMKAGEVLP